MPGTYFKSGSHNIICDVCGQKFKFHQVKKRWDGLVVCKDDFENDHPQKYIRVRESGLAVPVIRERPQDVDVSPICNIITSSAFADYSVADCSRADNSVPNFDIIRDLANSSIIPDGPFN
jgi:hypothetical protein